MAFLNNSGDIILDAVLTDTGRYRMAKGDGSFKIAKFALADDEIDYSLYQNANWTGVGADGAHASGSAYYDLNILKTPILEAFTNNTSLMKHKLISIPRTNILYLPTLELNALAGARGVKGQGALLQQASGTFYVATDSTTEGTTKLGGTTALGNAKWMEGFSTPGSVIRVDQGLDTTEIPPSISIPGDLKETQYIVEMDNRLGFIRKPAASEAATPSFIDDDNIASYYFTAGSDTDYIGDVPFANSDQVYVAAKDVIAGPRGTSINFSLGASIQLQTSTFLFTQLGGTEVISGVSYYVLDTIVRVTAATLGRSMTIPVRFIKAV